MRTRRDVNQRRIVIALRELGASVAILAGVGAGCPDLLVGWQGINHLLEVKNPAGRGARLTPAERAFMASWRGRVVIVCDVDDAVKAILGAISPQESPGTAIQG